MPDEKPSPSTILFAEDDEIVRSMACDLLRLLGYHVITAKDGAELTNIYQQEHDRISLVLFDWYMPGMTGAEIADKLWEINRQARLILASGMKPYREIEAYRQDGHRIGFLQKPFLVKDLKSEILRCLNAES